MDTGIGFADALQRVFPTTVSSYLPFRGWIYQETLCDGSPLTFDLRQCGGNTRWGFENVLPYLIKLESTATSSHRSRVRGPRPDHRVQAMVPDAKSVSNSVSSDTHTRTLPKK